ncbi:uncharacterized protein LOC129779998 [Toxorhynchites rutilus septentrionalis]|uniref:uncharacterized protein LOC129779998 n=1 Tax=Toxorhynchites rutilus septentrionalis TaxID=329112 RepID=UPI00247A99B8|nr:uncharacterized protein LOC129779998 [Toxorhynchites rutilus septentrionalis]
MNAFLACISIFVLIIVSIENGFCKLFPISPFDERLETSMFPNDRLSLDDCHLRYYKYGRQGLVKPAFGTPAYPTEFAHMAAIGWTLANGTVDWKCGGSLIWENYVLTAAHCTLDNGVAPDVARFGDINILSDDDDQYAQQLKIVEIFTHPEYRFSTVYNDIALLKLETNVTLHPTVVPACLWTDKEVRFPTLEATGWGNTGFAQERTPTLLKVGLKPVNNTECNKIYDGSNRRFRDGIRDQEQICAGDERMDTCPGDSGGPLQVKLLHNGKMSPFVVGITSFGTACGLSTPGVYTRVSAYFDWISETMQKQESNVFYWSLQPVSCATRYVYLRDYEKDVVIGRSKDRIDLDSDNAHIAFARHELSHKVDIGWQDYNVRRENCSGTLIADDTVLTLAECTSNYGVAPTYVVYDNIWDRYDIAEIHVHPEYREYSLYNNIAILKLRKRLKFSENLRPACIWHSQAIPSPQLAVSGIGRIDVNRFNTGEQYSAFEPMEINLLVRLSVNTKENCTIPSEFRSRLSRGLTKEHLCVGDPLFLLPTSCQLLYGAPMQLPMFRTNRYYQYAYGLNLFGRDCGFGEAAVSTRLFTHVDWMKTVLLPNFHDGDSTIQFINPDWKENDTCEFDYDEDITGICTHYSECSKVWNDFQAKRRVSFCSSSSVVCCPMRFIHKNQPADHEDELDSCSTEYSTLHPTISSLDELSSFPHVITVRWAGDNPSHCLASLITKRMVVTTASCTPRNTTTDVQVVLDNTTTISVEKTIIHPNYRKNDHTDNIALLRLSRNIIPTTTVFPACIWMNLTHTPLNLRLTERENTSSSSRQVVPMYNTDCQRDYNGRINADQLCVDELDFNPNNTCYNAGDQLAWFQPSDAEFTGETKVTPHVVGFYSHGERCDKGTPGVFTRITSYVDWIRQNI